MSRWLYQSRAEPVLVPDPIGADEMGAAWARLPEVPRLPLVPPTHTYCEYPWGAFAVPTPVLDVDWLKPQAVPMLPPEPQTAPWFVLPQAAYIPMPPTSKFDWYVGQITPRTVEDMPLGGSAIVTGGAEYPWGAVAASTPTLDIDWYQQTSTPVRAQEHPLPVSQAYIDLDSAESTATDNMQPSRVLRFLIRYK